MVSSPNTTSSQTDPPGKIPGSAPRWLTPELVTDTIRTWQPYYDQPLTEHEAVGILISVGELVMALEMN